MSDLQQRHPPDLPRKMRLGRHPRVAREKQSRAAVAHEQHDRLFVDIRLARRPRRVRTQHVERDAIDVEPIAASRGAPLRSIALDRAEELEISDIRHRLTRLQDITRIERLEHCRQAAEMVEMRVRRDDRGQLGRAVTPQKRHDDTPAGITPWPARPTIDQDPTPRRTAQRYRVALADV